MQSAVLKTSTFPHSGMISVGHALDARPALGDGALRVHYERDEEIFGQDEPARNVYRVLSGCVRTYRVLADGRRQIVDFHLAGDIFGLDGESRHHLGAEAVSGSQIEVVRRAVFMTDRSDGAQSPMTALMRKFRRAQDHMLMLGRLTACERVSAFLLDFHHRCDDGAFDLPMSRQDIADYLGLTLETVSRTINQLADARLIDLASCRKITIRNVAALERICQ